MVPLLSPNFQHRDRFRLLALAALIVCATAAFMGADASSAADTAGGADSTELWSVLCAVLQKNPLVLCFLIIACGMGLGSLRLVGMSFGTSGVLFSGLLFGHLGQQQVWQMPQGIGELGLVLFVYAVGLGAGPTFFPLFAIRVDN